MNSIDEAVAALRLGRPVAVDAQAILALETASDAMLDMVGAVEAPLILSGQRAAALGLGNRRELADAMAPARIERGGRSREEMLALIDPADDFDRAPVSDIACAASQTADAAILRLLGLAGLLPAAWAISGDAEIKADGEAILNQPRQLDIVSRANLPIGKASVSRMTAFRDRSSGETHVALLVGDGFGGQPPLIRIHDECLTGDVFGSLKCDCGPQLDAAIEAIEAEGAGILLYLRQEGRGIGIANKLRAYGLQDRGLDTVDANRRLGFPDETRDFSIAAGMLRALKVDAVRLMTNNPKKVEGLEAEGIAVERVAHNLPTNPHNENYLATKRVRSGHLD